MADGMILRVFAEEAIAAMRAADKIAERASMWATREAARRTARAAKRSAPVVTGAYKGSIKPSRRFRNDGDAKSLRVGPRGERVHLYAGKVELGHQVMADAYSAVAGELDAIYEGAMRRALRKYGP